MNKVFCMQVEMETLGCEQNSTGSFFRQPIWISESAPSVVIAEIACICFPLISAEFGLNFGKSDPVFPNGKASLV